MSAPPTVVGLGLCVIDHLYVVDDLDAQAERRRYLDRLVSVGGMVTNALLQARALGGRVELISQLGEDADGRLARRVLRERGVGTRSLQVSPAMPTTLALVFIDAASGERRFVTAARGKLEERVRGLALGAIRPGRVLLLDGHFPVQARRAARQARRLDVPVVGDLSDARPEYVSLLPFLDHPVLPEAFVKSWHPGDPADALRRLHDEFGGKGSSPRANAAASTGTMDASSAIGRVAPACATRRGRGRLPWRLRLRARERTATRAERATGGPCRGRGLSPTRGDDFAAVAARLGRHALTRG